VLGLLVIKFGFDLLVATSIPITTDTLQLCEDFMKWLIKIDDRNIEQSLNIGNLKVMFFFVAVIAHEIYDIGRVVKPGCSALTEQSSHMGLCRNRGADLERLLSFPVSRLLTQDPYLDYIYRVGGSRRIEKPGA
jgi:hypothetical protein